MCWHCARLAYLHFLTNGRRRQREPHMRCRPALNEAPRSALRFERAESEREGSEIMECGNKWGRLTWKYLMGVFIWRGSWQRACPWLLSFAFLSKHFSALEENPWGQCVQVWVSPSVRPCECVWVDVDVHAPVLHRVITYNHPKCLYCTNSITMLSEWLCGTGIAGVVNGPRPLRDYPGTGPGSDCYGARQRAC